MTDHTHGVLLDEGAQLFDLAVARGVDADRYRLITTPKETRMVPGPNWLTLPRTAGCRSRSTG
jgi:hypothetical protein